MTPGEHIKQRDAVRMSEFLLSLDATDRHGVYPVRKPACVVIARPGRVFVIPVVTEKKL